MNEQVTRSPQAVVGAPSKPVLAVRRVTYQILRVRVQSKTADLLKEYISFYEETEKETPVEAELVEAALNRAFEKDKGFQEFLRKKGIKGATRKGSAK
jgi:hypothetical protein